MIGRTISQYWTIGELSGGGMSVVYKTEDTISNVPSPYPSCPLRK